MDIKLDGDEALTEKQLEEVNELALSWDLPPVSSENRRWLLQKLLKHAVRHAHIFTASIIPHCKSLILQLKVWILDSHWLVANT